MTCRWTLMQTDLAAVIGVLALNSVPASVPGTFPVLIHFIFTTSLQERLL